MPPKLLTPLVVFAIITLSARASYGQCVVTDIDTIFTPETCCSPGAIAVSGDQLILGDRLSYFGDAFAAGRALIYEKTNGQYSLVSELRAPAPVAGESFGASVAIEGDLAVIGMSHDSDQVPFAGSAFIFERINGTWEQTYQCVPFDPVTSGFFGTAVTIVGDSIAVGAIGTDDGATDTGAVYIYRRNEADTWEFDRKLDRSNAQPGSFFGTSLASHENRLIAGALESTTPGPAATGRAYIFARDSEGEWVEEAELIAADGEAGDQFGRSVDIEGDYAVVGARYDHHSDLASSGSAYVFQFTDGTWSQVAKLVGSDRETVTLFGETVALEFPRILVGADDTGFGGFNVGAAFVYWNVNDQWEIATEITRPDTGHFGAFGRALDLQDSIAAVLAPSENPSRVYLIDLFSTFTDCNVDGFPDQCEPDCNDNGSADQCDITDQVSLDCDANGIPDECEPDCNQNGITDACDIESGASDDCDSNAIPDDCQLDCNGNEVADVCDLAFGTSIDCNGNDIPDDCESDCNNNGISDTCSDILNIFHQIPSPADTNSESWYFGYAVAADGPFLVVGEPANNDLGDLTGAAHVFNLESGTAEYVTTLYADPAEGFELFGESVAIHEETIVVGAPEELNTAGRSGSVHVFRRVGDEWNRVARLTASDGEERDFLGSSVAIHGSTIVAGARGDDFPGISAGGSAYVFREQNGIWQQAQKITPVDPCDQSQFGFSCSFDGTTLAIGSPSRSDFHPYDGAVFIFGETNGEWQQVNKLNAPLSTPTSEFGLHISIDEDRLIIGAPSYSRFGNALFPTGAAFIFKRQSGQWQLEEHLGSTLSNQWRHFGASVLIDNDHAYVFSSRNAVRNPARPGLTTYRRMNDTWRVTSNIQLEGSFEGREGQKLAIANSILATGLPSNEIQTVSGPRIGTVMLNNLDVDTDCNANLIPDDCELADNDCNQNGLPDDCDTMFADCNQNGIPDDCDITDCIEGDLTCMDCNGDGVPNICEPDCNADGIPDECEIANCPSGQPDCEDCNLNGVPDSCDPDCDGDGVPNTCEVTNNFASLFAQDYGAGTSFVGGLAFDGSHLIVGLRLRSRGGGNGAGSGAAMAFELVDEEWTYHSTILAPAAFRYEHFGDGIVIEGDTAIIGATNTNSMDAYLVFEKINNTWTYTSEFTHGNLANNPNSWRSIDIDNGTVVVGAPLDDEYGLGVGAAFVFRKVDGQWMQIAKLVPSDVENSVEFGASVAIDGSTIVVGAPRSLIDSTECGRVSVFREIEGKWSEIETLGPSDPRHRARFGKSVDIYNGVIAVKSAPNGGSFIDARPTLYVFEEDSGDWDQTGYLRPTSVPPVEIITTRDLAIEDDTIVLGLPEYSVPGGIPYSRIGTAVVVRKIDNQWQWVGNLISNHQFSNSYIGTNIFIQGGIVAVGASGFPFGGQGPNAVHMVQLRYGFPDCDGNEISDICDDASCQFPSAGCSACGPSNLLRTCYEMFENCDGDGNDGLCGTIPIERLSEFAQALVVDSKDYQDLCFFDIDRNGFINGKDIQPVVERLLP